MNDRERAMRRQRILDKYTEIGTILGTKRALGMAAMRRDRYRSRAS